MATRKFISRKTKKNIRTQKGGSGKGTRSSRRFWGSIRRSRGSTANNKSTRVIPQVTIANKRRMHNAAVKHVVEQAGFLKQSALTRYANPTTRTGVRTSYNSNKVTKLLTNKGHSPEVASRVAGLIRDRGIGFAAEQSGLPYERPQMQTTANYLLGKSKSIRGYHNTLVPGERSQFINYVNEQLGNRQTITSKNTSNLVEKYKNQYGTYVDPSTLREDNGGYMKVRGVGPASTIGRPLTPEEESLGYMEFRGFGQDN
jgi:hypothetical protein